MKIRREQPLEFQEIYDFVKTAFKTAEVSDGKEQEFVNKLRTSENYIPELALVAIENNEIVGHIMLTKMSINTSNKKIPLLLLAPLSVQKEYRSQGIGGQLIKEATKRAQKLGYEAILLIGDPAYYQRYGFVKASQYGILPDITIPLDYVLIHAISSIKLEQLAGTAVIPH